MGGENMKFLAVLLLSVFATSSAAEVIRYKANFGPVSWRQYDGVADESYDIDAPAFYKGYLSVEWAMDTSDPGPQLIDFVAFVKGIGANSAFIFSNDLAYVGQWDSGGFDYGELYEGWFGPNEEPSQKNPSAEELRRIGMSFGGVVWGEGGYELGSNFFTFGAESKWVTTAPVPLPAGFPLLLGALGTLAVWSRKRRWS